ncbi:MAG: tetratricopeptide repeat protein [Deltaproteobacteria bacterium]|nr:tetratricopeptide repeat protein [Deltaproteobacteria bacterium]
MKVKYNIPDRHLKVMISLLLILAIIIAYGQVKSFDFVGYDDQEYVTENSHVQKGITVDGIIWTFTTFHAANWHPLTWLSHMLDCELYGLNPMGHHWTNLILHMANTILLFLVLKQMTGAVWRSAFVAALFALHPLHVESVAWVSERKDVLSTFFGLLTMGAYYRYTKAPDVKKYLWVIIFLSLGLMAKPMLVTFPFVLLLLDFWPLNRFQYKNDYFLQSCRITCYGSNRIYRLILEKIPLFIPVVISSCLTFLAQKSGGTVKALEALSLKTRIANAFVSYVSYVLKMFWPSKLAVFYPHPGDSLPAWQIIGAALLIACACFFAIRMARKYPYVGIGLYWYLGTLVPVIGLLQVGEQAMADRYTYIPLIGFFIIVAWGVSDLSMRWRYRKIFLGIPTAIILSAMAVCTSYQLTYWKNGITLFEHAIEVTENNYKVQNNLGTAFGQIDIDKAVYHYKEALKIKPDYVTALYNLGTALLKKKNYDEAVVYFKKVLKINPQKTDARMNLANVLFIQGKYDEVFSHYNKIIKTDSKNTDARMDLANIFFLQAKPEKAISHYREILKTDSENANAHYNLAYMLSAQKNTDQAEYHYKETLRINPNHEKAHYNLANIELKQGKLKEAFTHFAEAIKIKPDFVQAYNKIGLMLFKQRKFNNAKVFFSKALNIDPNCSEARKNLEILNQTLSSGGG